MPLDPQERKAGTRLTHRDGCGLRGGLRARFEGAGPRSPFGIQGAGLLSGLCLALVGSPAVLAAGSVALSEPGPGNPLVRAAPLHPSNQDPLPDVVEIDYGQRMKRLEGRLLCETDPDWLWFEGRTGVERLPREDMLRMRVDSRRTRLEGWFLGLSPQQDADQAFAAVAEAERLGLFPMARLEAYRTLLIDSRHVAAHEYLGHRYDKRSGRYLWPVEKGPDLETAAYFEFIRKDWENRIALESEHFAIETDCGVELAVYTLFDLERLYLFWMRSFGYELQAFEDVRQLDRRRMAWRVFKDRFTPGYDLIVNASRPAEYDPTEATQIRMEGLDGKGMLSSNLVYSYLPPGEQRPQALFELGAQQLLTSTLLFGNPEATDPSEPSPAGVRPRYDAVPHWAELGLSYWIARQFDGPLGFAAYRPLAKVLDADTLALALEPVGSQSSSPLSLARQEITNLIGLPYEYFHLSLSLGGNRGDAGAWHQAKARAWVAYLLGEAPRLERAERSGRSAFLVYLRDALRTGRGPSSGALDDAFQGPAGRTHIEDLEAGFFDWLARY